MDHSPTRARCGIRALRRVPITCFGACGHGCSLARSTPAGAYRAGRAGCGTRTGAAAAAARGRCWRHRARRGNSRRARG
eukprot:6549602-Prymnesium_polylepis.1